ncbi:MAG TPA: hypothetical protein VMC84_09025 [Methanocella sp.]|uniref:hypothetical protein n=1 Tax=Methanocella sp. TaxID=2052833 RepID=UPI002D13290F|nr:hypothetical protein [Methanocella sp.]HTY91304.1 hypothetical protein [Methanocella sp.]
MNKRIINNLMVLSAIAILLIAGSTSIAGTASGQQQYGAGGTGSAHKQAPPATGTSESPVIQGLEGLQGFKLGHNQLTLAIIPLSQKDNQLTFEVAGFAITSPESGEAVVYSMENPLPGIIDPSQYTLQIDISSLSTSIDTAGYIDSSEVYDTMRSDPKVMIIDLDMNYQGKQDSQTVFNVNGVDIVPPDGKMQTYSMQQPTQLIVDTKNGRVAMVAFPEMTSTIGGYYGATYSQVEPVVYTQPVPIMAPIYVPYLRPIPIYVSGIVSYNRFFFGTGFRSFYARDRFTHVDRFSHSNSFPVRQPRNDFANNARNNLVAGQRRGEFNQQRNLGTGVKGGIGGFRGGVKASAGRKAGGGGRRR